MGPEHMGSPKRDPQGAKDTKMVPAEPEGRPKQSLKPHEKGYQFRSKVSRGRPQGPKPSQRGPQKDPKSSNFGALWKTQILKDLPYEITEFTSPGLPRSDSKPDLKQTVSKAEPKVI